MFDTEVFFMKVSLPLQNNGNAVCSGESRNMSVQISFLLFIFLSFEGFKGKHFLIFLLLISI